MKVPFTSNQSNHQNIVDTKPIINSNNSTILSYEPKSVLENRGSPRIATVQKPAHKTDIVPVSDEPVQVDDHVLNQFEDWDSFMKELGLQEDSNHNNITESKPLTNQQTQFQYIFPPTLPELPLVNSFESTQLAPSDISQFPHIIQNNIINPFDIPNDVQRMNLNNLGFDYVDELIRFAECFETNSVQQGHVVLARLNQRLAGPTGKPLQRACFYFKEALQTLLTGSTRLTQPSISSTLIQTINAKKYFSNISPIPMFSGFTANQAVLEAVDDGSTMIHVIDFDICLGGIWASFLKELADKADSRKTQPPYLRITALVPDEYGIESKLIAENLTQFAAELNIGFDIDFVLLRTFEYLSFKSIEFMEGEKVVVMLSNSIFRRVGGGFVNDLRRVSPHVVVHVDNEGLMGFNTTSFRQAVIDGLEFYSTLLESLEASNVSASGDGHDWMRKIETFVMFPKILEGMEAAGQRNLPWREAFVAAGFRPVELSQFADFQAECILRRIQVRGFHVMKRNGEMRLCWHGRALVATSAWRI
ncbi:hypothetical protein Leryth_021282 [Lithospermum erythrorhizon]|nr:hypothetical protein Leryth_021282 [Lithospermum erythrorhizon]